MNTIADDSNTPHLLSKSDKEYRQYQQQQQQQQHTQTPSSSYWYSNRSNYTTLPYIHTFNSEWIDSPENSPSSRPSKYYYQSHPELQHHLNMPTATATAKIETPSKPTKLSYATPISTSKYSQHQALQHDINTGEKTSRTSTPNALIDFEQQNGDGKTSVATAPTDIAQQPPATNASYPDVTNFDIFWSMLNNITGKDKMAKVGQYSLRLLLHHARVTEKWLSDDSININVINKVYNGKLEKLRLLKNFAQNPRDFIKVIVILVTSIFNTKFTKLAANLGTYRQFLRFGKSPFRIRELLNKVVEHVDSKSGKIDTKLFNKATLGEAISLYYNINDEATLLYKMNLYNNKSVYQFVSRHESLAWYCESWLGLYNAYLNLQNIAKQEMDINIHIQVKKRAKVLSKQLLGGTAIRTIDWSSSSTSSSSPPTSSSVEESSKDAQLLNEIKFKKHNAYLDIYKNLSDIVFNSYTVFSLKMPFNTLQIWMGISASSLSTIKLYRETKKKLIEQRLRGKK